MKTEEFLINAQEPWTVYRSLIDLEGLSDNDPLVKKAREAMLNHPLVKGLIDELQNWPGKVISSHKSAGQSFHKLSFLADLGITKEDPGVKTILSKVMEHPSVEGLPQLSVVIPFGDKITERTILAWALCDAPLLLYSVAKMGKRDDSLVRAGVDYLLTLTRNNGWPCTVSQTWGNFRGPGKKADACPFVNLIMLKLLALYDDEKIKEEARNGVENLLECWEDSREIHPYMFFMGTDFRKLKAPFVWYDLLHVTEVLSHYDQALKDPRFLEMLELINSKANESGHFLAESEWTAWKNWDFGQKKVPSSWITFLVRRINGRVSPIGK